MRNLCQSGNVMGGILDSQVRVRRATSCFRNEFRRRAIAPAALFIALLCGSHAVAQPFTQQGPKLTGTGAVGAAQQGASVAVSSDGSTAIVGGPGDNGFTGAVWVFTRNGTIWSQQGPKLVGTGVVGNSQQGASVALSADGNTAILGGPSDSSNAGAIWVFTRSAGVWTQQGSKLIGNGAVGSSGQGTSVSVSADGNTIIAGGPADNGGIGAAWVFTRSGGVWTQQGAKLVGTGSIGNCVSQGTSVALSQDGNTAAVGGPFDHLSGGVCSPFNSGVGAVWVFTQVSPGVWTQQAKLVNTAIPALQGHSVALSANGNVAIVGGCNGICFEEPTGAVAGVFIRSGSFWSQQGNALNCTTGQQIGFAGNGACVVALSADGNTAILGGGGLDLGPGAALVFIQSGGVWTQQTEKLIGNDAVGTFQSRSVALSADSTTAVVGAPSDNSSLGAAWAFGPHIAAATHDFNGDSRSDILWRDTSGNVMMWLMNGASTPQASVLGNITLNWSIIGQRDFNGDGDADILWRDTGGNVGMWLMNGTNALSTAVLGNVPSNWSVVGTGDFNGDGRGDILWRDTSGNVGIWFMNGTTIQQTAVVGNMPAAWVVAGADMKGDIFWRNAVTGDVGMWIMNGPMIVQSIDFGSVPLTWSIVGIGDFDGNGSFDILWRDSSGNVGVWLMNGTQIMSTAVLGNVVPNWSIAQTGDYSGNGRSDILWVDNVSNVAVWLMNSTSISSVVSYGSVPSVWNIQSLNAE